MTDRPPWRPLSKRTSAEPEVEVLVEGVPGWLITSIAAWVAPQLTQPTYDIIGSQNGTEPSPPKLQAIERALKVQLKMGPANAMFAELMKRLMADQDFALDLVDYLLHASGATIDRDAGRLMSILEEAGSAWTVGYADYGFELQRRVEPAAATALQEATATGRPGEHLQRAWSAAFGRDPNPGYSYSEAVKAVESAAAPIFLPANPLATLGTIIAAIRDKPTKWRVTLKTPPTFDSVTAFNGMFELLWKAQHDRHGIPAGTSADDIEQHEAEAAVHVAVTCVLWLTRGLVVSA